MMLANYLCHSNRNKFLFSCDNKDTSQVGLVSKIERCVNLLESINGKSFVGEHTNFKRQVIRVVYEIQFASVK